MRSSRLAEDEGDQQPQVEAVEATAGFAAQRGGPIRAGSAAFRRESGSSRRSRARRTRAATTSSAGARTPRGPTAGSRTARRPEPRRRATPHPWPRRRHEASRHRGRIGDRRGRRLEQGRRMAPAKDVAREPEERPDEHDRVGEGDHGDGGLGQQGRPDPEPVGDRRVVGIGDEDRVQVREEAGGQGDVGHSPARRRGREDQREGEERIDVALVDPGRDDVEREGEHGQAHQQGHPVGPPGHEPQHEPASMRPGAWIRSATVGIGPSSALPNAQ